MTFPENKPAPQEYTTTGTYVYDIPYWCTAINLTLLGAGGGGTYGGTNNGVGGGAGSWQTATLERGSDIPWATSTINITVGQGGALGAITGASAMAGGVCLADQVKFDLDAAGTFQYMLYIDAEHDDLVDYCTLTGAVLPDGGGTLLITPRYTQS